MRSLIPALATREELFAKIVGDLEKFFIDQRCQVYIPVTRQPVTNGQTHRLIDKDEFGITKNGERLDRRGLVSDRRHGDRRTGTMARPRDGLGPGASDR
jgi:hypothetical protein